jgi:transcription termination/antitermination protein NusA
MVNDLNRVLEQVSKDKGIPKKVLTEALEQALLTAARKKLGYQREIEAQFNEEVGEVELFEFMTVVKTVENELNEIEIKKARKLDPEAELGDSIGQKIDRNLFGRIAAQTAKQVIIQKVRDAERDIIYDEYKGRIGEIITGIVRRIERGNVIVDLGQAEAILPRQEQVRSETAQSGDRLQAYLLEVHKESRGPQLVLSRKDRGLLTKLFELEVPEIAEGIVEIKRAAREAGVRSKIAVYSNDSDVDPVGACVGMKGSRVQSVVQELRGEKIDIVCWDPDPARFVCNAIAPAEVVRVVIHDHNKNMEIIVPDDQLSLAIGRKGQNVRLAAEVTGWSIDILSESKLDELTKRAKYLLSNALGVDDGMALILHSQSFRTPDDVATSSTEQMMKIPGISEERVGIIKGAADDFLARCKQAKAEGRELVQEIMKKYEEENPPPLTIEEKPKEAAPTEAEAKEEKPSVASEDTVQDKNEEEPSTASLDGAEDTVQDKNEEEPSTEEEIKEGEKAE